jgi:hypothetical protein
MKRIAVTHTMAGAPVGKPQARDGIRADFESDVAAALRNVGHDSAGWCCVGHRRRAGAGIRPCNRGWIGAPRNSGPGRKYQFIIETAVGAPTVYELTSPNGLPGTAVRAPVDASIE